MGHEKERKGAEVKNDVVDLEIGDITPQMLRRLEEADVKASLTGDPTLAGASRLMQADSQVAKKSLPGESTYSGDTLEDLVEKIGKKEIHQQELALLSQISNEIERGVLDASKLPVAVLRYLLEKFP